LYYLLTSSSRVLEKLTGYTLCYFSIKIFSWTHFKMFVTLLAVNKETIFLIRKKEHKTLFLHADMWRFRYQWVLQFFDLDLIVGRNMIHYSPAYFIIGIYSIYFCSSQTLKFCIDLLHLIMPTVCHFRWVIIIIIIIMNCEKLGVVPVS
jgi:hypothetical protein